MQHVNIVTQSGIKSIKPQSGAVGYVLETQTPKGPATLSRVFTVSGQTANASELTALIEALKRLRESCDLTIYTESTYIAGAVEQRCRTGGRRRTGKQAGAGKWQIKNYGRNL